MFSDATTSAYFQGVRSGKKTEKASWAEDGEDEQVFVRGTHNHPVEEAEERPPNTLRMVQTKSAPNTPRIDNTFVMRMKKTKPFFMLVSASTAGDGGFKIMLVSDAFTEATGFTSEEALQKDMFFNMGRSTDSATVSKIINTMQNCGKTNDMVMLYKKDGQPFWCDMTVSPMGMGHGYYMCIQTDVSMSQEDDKRERNQLGRNNHEVPKRAETGNTATAGSTGKTQQQQSMQQVGDGSGQTSQNDDSNDENSPCSNEGDEGGSGDSVGNSNDSEGRVSVGNSTNNGNNGDTMNESSGSPTSTFENLLDDALQDRYL